MDKALEYAQKSLLISQEISDYVGIARALNNLGVIYGLQNNYQKQKLYYREAVRINKKTESNLGLVIDYMNLGAANANLNQMDTAFYYYNEALKKLEVFENIHLSAKTYLLLADYYFETEQIDQGLEYAKKALHLGIDNNLKKIIHDSYNVLHRLYNKSNNTNEAYRYALLENNIKDSLDLESTMTKLSQMEMKYQFEKVLQENNSKQKIKEYRYIAFISLIILFIALLLFLFKLKIKNNLMARKRLETDLELKNKELTSSAMTILKTNEVLSEMALDLKRIKKEAIKDETKSAILKLINKIQRSKKTEIWEDFELSFKQVHTGFYDNLLKNFPNLTPNELRLSALLKLNLTSKEISELTGQQITTVETARIRLRKKLGITDRKTSLVIFLSKY
jgi:tetratricopeptide (TPR) repeat protein